MRVVNFVHGELVMLSAFAVYFLGSEEAGLPFWLALSAIAAAAAVAVICQYCCSGHCAKDPELLHYWHRRVLRHPLCVVGDLRPGADCHPGDHPWRAASVVCSSPSRGCLPPACASRWRSRCTVPAFTRPGKGVRAVEQDREATPLMGISSEKVYVTAHDQRSAGRCWRCDAGSLFGIDPEMGAEPLKSFIIADRRHGQHRRHGVGRTVYRTVGQRDRHAVRRRVGVHRFRDPDVDPDRPAARAVRL